MVIRLPDRQLGRTPNLADSAPQLHGGGSGANVAVALARLGMDVAMIGTVGDDGYGRWVCEDLLREGVDVRGLKVVHDAFTPMVMALIEPNGERLIVVWPPEGGAHLWLVVEAANPEPIASSYWLHVTGMCLRASPSSDAVLHGMELARAANVPVSLDLNLHAESWELDRSTREIFARAVDLSDVVFGNAEEEIALISGADSVVVDMKVLCDGKRVVVARKGADGALVTTPTEAFHVPAFETSVVDVLGAGDAFNGGFIAARLANHDIKEATRWGHAVASIQVAQIGARGLPSLDDLKQVLDR